MLVEIEIDKIEVGLPLFRWLLGRMSDKEFRDNHWDLCSVIIKEGYPTREDYLEYLYKKYEKYIDLPILVERYMGDNGIARYKIRDGRRRLSILKSVKGKSSVECILCQPHWGKEDWEFGQLIDLKIEKGMIEDIMPQKNMIKGEPPYNMYFYEDGKRKHIDSFLVYTGFKIPYILKNTDKLIARGDEYQTVENSRHQEVLFGLGKHEPIAKRYGTNPLNGYLLGHFASGPNAEKDPLVQKYGKFVRVQQYFISGFWGKPVEGYPYNNIPTVKEQIIQNNLGVPLLFKLGILKEDTKIYFADQSADKPCPLNQYFNLFQGKNCLKEYYEWLPEYFKNCRADHFGIPIEEVIKWIPST